MKSTLEFLVKNLVNHPDEVVINEKVDSNFVHLQVIVNPEDMGKVIGKSGKIATAIRTLIRSIARNENKRVAVKIGEE